MGLFLIAAYAPVGCAPDADWDEFFAGLDQVKKLAGADDIVVIGGDWNSSMGVGEKKDDFDGTDDRALATCGPLGPHGNPHTNDAGRRLLRYLALQDMVVPGTFFRKGKYSTWVHPCSKNGHQIDHFVTYKSDLRRVRDCGRKAQLVTSDHNGLGLTLQLTTRLAKTVTKKSPTKHDSSVLIGPNGLDARLEFDAEDFYARWRPFRKRGSFRRWVSATSSWRPSRRRATFYRRRRSRHLYADGKRHGAVCRPRTHRRGLQHTQAGITRPSSVKKQEQGRQASRTLNFMNFMADPRSLMVKQAAARAQRKSLKEAVSTAKSQWIISMCEKINLKNGQSSVGSGMGCESGWERGRERCL
jgi:hypothetical protein